LQAAYWHNATFTGEPAVTRIEPRPELFRGFLDLIGSNISSPDLLPLPAGLPHPFAVRWQGELTAPLTGEYQISLSVLGSARLFVDGRLALDSATMRPVQVMHHRLFPHENWPVPEERGVRVFAAPVQLDAGRPCAVTVEYQSDAPGPWIFQEAMLRLGWQPPSEIVTPAMAAAAELARTADVAIVAVRTFESEEMDRPDLALPDEQATLIRAVAAANPRTIVLVMSGGPVEMASWEGQTPAVVQCWFGGQELGAAVARLLVGDVAPSGKLPLTIPLSAAQTPLRTPEQYPGVAGRLDYSEGLAVGYRGYDQLGLPVQYPFGHGLSYTRFAYRNLAVTGIATPAGEVVRVEFSVANSGARAGVEIAQIYIEFPLSAGEPPRRLAGWVRCALEPGEERALAVTLARKSPEHLFDIWDETERGWRGASGDYRIRVGPSSRDLPLSAPLHLA
jgi:beta-glucosidase